MTTSRTTGSPDPEGADDAAGARGASEDGEVGAEDALAAPRLLSRSAEPGALPTPVHDSAEVSSLHVDWARLTGTAEERTAEVLRSGGTGGVRARVRARVAAAAGAQASGDRALIGDLIRAVDVLARHLDETAARVHDLELLVQEVVDRVSEDLVRVEAALERGRPAEQGPATGGTAEPV